MLLNDAVAPRRPINIYLLPGMRSDPPGTCFVAYHLYVSNRNCIATLSEGFLLCNVRDGIFNFKNFISFAYYTVM